MSIVNDAGDPSNSALARLQNAGRASSSWWNSAATAATAGNATADAATGGPLSLGLVSILAIIVAVACMVGAVILVTAQGGRNNRAGFIAPGDNSSCSFITCPEGAAGPQGRPGNAGPAGAQGAQGVKGDKGDQGVQGQPGQQGPMGECTNNNPFCTQGPKGDTGAQGIQGATGGPGLIGPTGAQGAVGASGPSGPSGPIGNTGAQGIQGIQGIPGVCNCLNLSLVNLVNLGVNGSTTLNGTTTLNGVLNCPGGALSPNCFGLTVCPNFANCNLQAQGLLISSTNASVVPLLQVGMLAGDAGKGVVIFGLPGGNNITTLTSNVVGTYYMSSLYTPMVHRSWFSTAIFESVGSSAIYTSISSSGTVNITGSVGVSVVAGTGSNVFIGAGTNFVNVNSGGNSISSATATYNVSATNIYMNQGNLNPYWGTQSTTSLECQAGGTLPPKAGVSMLMSTDIIMAANTSLLSASSTGLISVSGLLVCGQVIKSASTTLEIQDSTLTKFLDVWATIQNSQGSQPVTFNDFNGVNFQQTALFDSSPSPLVVNDPQGLSVSVGPLVANGYVQSSSVLLNTLFLNTNASGYPGGHIVMGTSGTETLINGNLYVQGTIASLGSCCVSDVRAKEHIREVPPRVDLQTIINLPRRVSFRYTKEYQDANRFVKDHIHDGFIAQELEGIVPRAVGIMNATLGKQVINDFRHILYDRIVPHVVGAVKELHAMHMALRSEYEDLKAEMRELHSKLHQRFP